MDLSWMAWTWQTIVFFVSIVIILTLMIIWEKFSPGGNPRKGILGLNTTRGDRLFLSLLGSAFIHLAWLGVSDFHIAWAGLVSLLYAVGVFRYV